MTKRRDLGELATQIHDLEWVEHIRYAHPDDLKELARLRKKWSAMYRRRKQFDAQEAMS